MAGSDAGATAAPASPGGGVQVSPPVTRAVMGHMSCLNFCFLDATQLGGKRVAISQLTDCRGAPYLQSNVRSPFMPAAVSARLGNEAGMQVQQPAQRRTLTVGAQGSGMLDAQAVAPPVVGVLLLCANLCCCNLRFLLLMA